MSQALEALSQTIGSAGEGSRGGLRISSGLRFKASSLGSTLFGLWVSCLGFTVVGLAFVGLWVSALGL